MNKIILYPPQNSKVQSNARRPIAFLDRDGILNIDTGYVHDTSTAIIVDGAIDAVKHLKSIGFTVVVVSNQSGVARGYFDETTVSNFNAWLATSFLRGSAQIDAFYFCPHHQDHGNQTYRQDCTCRKPKPGMLLEACSDFNGDMSASFLIGDRSSDMEAAEAAGIPGHLFEGGNLKNFIDTFLVPDQTFEAL